MNGDGQVSEYMVKLTRPGSSGMYLSDEAIIEEGS